MTRRYAIIGAGRIGSLFAELAAEVPGWTLNGVFRRGEDLDKFIATRPEIVFECASRHALAELAPPLLRAGIDVVPLSSTAFCDPEIERRLRAAAEAGPGRLEIPPGAIGAIEALATAREDRQLRRVVYRQVKPPALWQVTPLRSLADLGAVTSRQVVLAGSVREIAAHFPDNLNTAVGIALAGLGLDATRMELVADPALRATAHELDAEVGTGFYRVAIGGEPREGGRGVTSGGDPVDYTTFGLLRILRRRGLGLVV